jgi:hypothetical protein
MKIDLDALDGRIKKYIIVELYIALKNDDYDKLEEVSQKAERLVKLEKMAKH